MLMRMAPPALCCLLFTAACTSSTPRPGVETLDGAVLSADPDGGAINTGDAGNASSSGTVASSGTQSGGSSQDNPSSGLVDVSSSSSSGSVGSSFTNASSTTAPACQGSRDCDLGNICDQNICVPGCDTDNDCPLSRRICSNSGPNGECVQCESPTDCPFMGAICDDGSCRLQCTGAGQCPPQFSCREADMVCVRCIMDAECGDGRICEDNECVDGCRADATCNPGQICENADCVQGCRTNPNTCPVGSVCLPNAGGASSCQVGCTTPADCGDATQFECTNNQCVRRCSADGECPDGAICTSGSCVAGCRPPERGCDRGEYCSGAAGMSGQCLAGCDADEDCAFQREDKCNVTTHACVECLTAMDCNVPGFDMPSCNNNICELPCNPAAGFDTCIILGLDCDAMTMTCVECNTAMDCDPFQACTNHRCVDTGGRPLCAECDNDDQCGGPNDLCVTRTIRNSTEQVCGVDCSTPGSPQCPVGTTCQQVGGGNGTPARGMQCLPANSIHQATCAGYNDLVAEQQCLDSRQCGMLGGANAQLMGDAICSGAGASDGHCSVLCTMGGNDCPAGFFCEDPPDTPQQEFRPRCGPNP